ncbi:MAG TPA: dienelactone hydrolase family protein [bacterium]|nr:dienelactone hydrolase family protein [bacterium]
MRSGSSSAKRWGRRRFIGYALTGAAAACRISGLDVWPAAPAWGAPAKPPKTPPAPGDPPDKVTTTGVTIKPDDPAISAGAVEFPGIVATLQGYLAAPAGGRTYPGVLLLHDVDGLTEHARDVARRLAKIGYVTLVPDLLSRTGGTSKAGTPTQAGEAMTRIPIPQFLQDGNAAVRFLGSHPLVSKTRTGMMAFGLGGVFSWFLLSQNSDLRAGVVYYGNVPRLALVSGITAAVMSIYGDNDGHDPDDLKDFDAEMKKSGRPWAYKIEPKTGRGFFDDTRKAYTPDAAKDAWKMSVDWYAKNLTG